MALGSVTYRIKGVAVTMGIPDPPAVGVPVEEEVEIPATPSPFLQPLAGPEFAVPMFGSLDGDGLLPQAAYETLDGFVQGGDEGYDQVFLDPSTGMYVMYDGNSYIPCGYYGYDGGDSPDVGQQVPYEHYNGMMCEGLSMEQDPGASWGAEDHTAGQWDMEPVELCSRVIRELQEVPDSGDAPGAWGLDAGEWAADPGTAAWCADAPTLDENNFAEGSWNVPPAEETVETTSAWKEEEPPSQERWTAGTVSDTAAPSTPPASTSPPGGRSRGKGRGKRQQERLERLERLAAQAKDVVSTASGTGASSTGSGTSTPKQEKPAPPPQGQQMTHPVTYTTVMLRNIPNKYTQEMLVKQLNQDFRGKFDFLYLPIDFKNGCNVGYGFINFRTVGACEIFVNKFNGVDVRKCLPGLNSRKVAEVTPARVQGLEENVRRLRNSPVMNELSHRPEWMPMLMDEQGEELVFPVPEQPCPPVKPRRRGRDENRN